MKDAQPSWTLHDVATIISNMWDFQLPKIELKLEATKLRTLYIETTTNKKLPHFEPPNWVEI